MPVISGPGAPSIPAPLTSSPITPSTITPSTITPSITSITSITAPTGLDAATTTGPTPSAGGPIATAVTGGLNALGARLATLTPTPPLLDLVPGTTSSAVSITTVLKQLGAQVGPAIDGLAAAIKGAVGVDVPPALIAAAKANPDRVADFAVLSPSQMRVGFDALNAQHKARGAASLAKATQLPSTTNTAKLDAIAIKRPADDLQQVAQGLWRGDVQNPAVSDVAAKKNIVLAEIVDRLASNAGKPKNERFVVEHNGSRFTSLKPFLEALQKDGYSLEAKITHRVADFVALKTKAPDGSILDVPVAAMVKTGVKDATGAEAIVPTVHSEIVFSLKAGPTSSTPHLDGDIKWYQGISGTGFFPCNLMRSSPWTGTTTAATLDASTSWQAARLCGVFADVIQDVAAGAGLAMAGYGITGVCNDSVAVIQQALTSTTTAYPLVMRDDVLLPAVAARLKDTDKTDDAALKQLQTAITQVPSDDVASTLGGADSARRALASLPWPAGKAPFAVVEQARTILGAVP